MKRLSLSRRRKKRLSSDDAKMKQIITGAAVPKSLGLIELEKNYALLAEMMTGIIGRMQKLENNIEKLEKTMAHLIHSRKKTSFVK